MTQIRELTDSELDGVCGGSRKIKDSFNVIAGGNIHVNANHNTVSGNGVINILSPGSFSTIQSDVPA